MTVYDAAFVNTELSKPTSIFGLRLWVVIGIFVGAVIVVILFLLSLCITASRRRSTSKLRRPGKVSGAAELTPVVSKEIQEIVHDSHPDQRPLVPQARYIHKYCFKFYEIFFLFYSIIRSVFFFSFGKKKEKKKSVCF